MIEETRMSTPSNSSIQVTSKHFVDKLEMNIIQIARAYAIEFGINVDPDAKKMTREAVQIRANALLSDNERECIRKVWEETLKIIKGRGSQTEWDIDTYARNVYETLKAAKFDDI
jgi:hypothetical protein